MARKLAEMRKELSRANGSYFEQLAVGRVVATWALLQQADIDITTAAPGSLAAKFTLKRHADAERGFAAAMRSLSNLQGLAFVQAGVAATSESPQPVRATGT